MPSTPEPPPRVLVLGGKGFLGQNFLRLYPRAAVGAVDVADRVAVAALLDAERPDVVVNCAGKTGRPNVDWCETHQVETIRANVVGTLTLADVCRERGLVLINYATGCIFEYDDAHPLGSGVGSKEEDIPNFTGSFYSKTKAMVYDPSFLFPSYSFIVFLLS